MKIITIAIAVGAAGLLSACAETVAQGITEKEDLLAAAGFAQRPANTPQRQASLAQLPANKFVPRTKNGQTQYVYADPTVCDCLYVGDQKAYSAYKQDLFVRRIANQQEMTAMTYQNNWDWNRWDWGPWGGGPWGAGGRWH
ncbi:MAG: hypothetical protein JWP49_2828 [Phenylobacterium sp.]|jgi:hypothetical protein|nr:hypothetical protein [Phenylobacterium sp.]